MQINSDWVTSLNSNSSSLTQHCFLKGLFQTQQLERHIQDAFEQFKYNSNSPLLRIYINNGHRYDLSKQLINTDFVSEIDQLSFEKVLANALNSKEFCISFNGLTKWDYTIDLNVRNKLIRPLSRVFGIPERGIDSYAFIGNYGYTPFGIHDDNDHSLLFHLGPCSKKIWILSRSEYIELHGDETPSFDYEDYLPKFEFFEMEPGDFVFIPKGDFHVLKTEGFSITLGLSVFPGNGLNCLNDLVEEIDTISDLDKVDKFFKNIDSDTLPLPLNTLDLAKKTLPLRRQSNDYITTLPLLNVTKVTGQCILNKHKEDRVLVLREVNRDYYFAKGRHFAMNKSDQVHELIQEINFESEFMVEDYINRYKNKLDYEVIMKIFEILISFGFLYIVI